MLRIGILGAARIAPNAIIKPAQQVPSVELAGIAARDPAKAFAFAQRYNIPVVHGDYSQLVDDPAIDAVYIPLPNNLHHEWTIQALKAGKHVLCEKPLASNGVQAEEMARTADEAGLILMEAFHYRYHPLVAKIQDIIASGAIGKVRHIEAYSCTVLRRKNDIRFQYELAGGALMDMGCYAVHMARFIAQAEPTVTSAKAALSSRNVDRRMEADLAFPDDVSGRIVCSLFSRALLRIQLIVRGERGAINVINPMLPHYGHLVYVHNDDQRTWSIVKGNSTYTHQLRAFLQAVDAKEQPITDGWDGVANMRVIDAIYRAAGLPERE